METSVDGSSAALIMDPTIALDETDSTHRLPRNVVPSHYDIKIQPDLENCTFHGEVTISLHVSIYTA